MFRRLIVDSNWFATKKIASKEVLVSCTQSFDCSAAATAATIRQQTTAIGNRMEGIFCYRLPTSIRIQHRIGWMVVHEAQTQANACCIIIYTAVVVVVVHGPEHTANRICVYTSPGTRTEGNRLAWRRTNERKTEYEWIFLCKTQHDFYLARKQGDATHRTCIFLAITRSTTKSIWHYWTSLYMLSPLWALFLINRRVGKEIRISTTWTEITNVVQYWIDWKWWCLACRLTLCGNCLFSVRWKEIWKLAVLILRAAGHMVGRSILLLTVNCASIIKHIQHRLSARR